MNNNDDPLAVLEDILKDARAKKGAKAKPGTKGKPTQVGAGADVASDLGSDDLGIGVATGAKANPPSPEEIARKEKEEARRRQQELLEKQRLEEERLAQIQKQKQLLEEEVMRSPQYQAAKSQDLEKEQAKTAAIQAQDGFEIRQIEHDEIEQ